MLQCGSDDLIDMAMGWRHAMQRQMEMLCVDLQRLTQGSDQGFCCTSVAN